MKIWCAAIVAALSMLIANAQAAPPSGEAGFERIAVPLLEPGRPVATDPALTGYVFKPAGQGLFPAIVIMHGCNGLGWKLRGQPGWALLKGYAERYAAKAYVALVLDSFEPRGIDEVCGRGQTVSAVRRAWDAFSAARYLGSLDYVDQKRVVLQGDSHGGSTVLVALQAGRWKLPNPYAAAIAFYPTCFRVRGFTAPLLILIGDADDWTPAPPCIAMAKHQAQIGNTSLILKVYPGATHAFDFPAGPRVNRLGHHMAFDGNATMASREAIDDFLARYLP